MESFQANPPKDNNVKHMFIFDIILRVIQYLIQLKIVNGISETKGLRGMVRKGLSY